MCAFMGSSAVVTTPQCASCTHPRLLSTNKTGVLKSPCTLVPPCVCTLPRRSDWFACVLEARNSLGHKDYRMSTFNTAITHPVPVCNVNQVAVLTTGVGFLQGSLALDI